MAFPKLGFEPQTRTETNKLRGKPCFLTGLSDFLDLIIHHYFRLGEICHGQGTHHRKKPR
jgi:hypothetical protein